MGELNVYYAGIVKNDVVITCNWGIECLARSVKLASSNWLLDLRKVSY